MKTNHGVARILLVWCVLAALFPLSGCGYSLHRQSDLPFTEIQLGAIENRTLEPKLQDKLHAALTEEFMKQGIMVSPVAGTKLSAVVHSFDMAVLSEKRGITIEYRINIRADFTVVDKNGKKEVRKIESPFIVTLTADKNLNTLLATKERAEEEAMKDLAMRIAGELIYK